MLKVMRPSGWGWGGHIRERKIVGADLNLQRDAREL